MGGQRMYFVANVLKGVTVSLPWLSKERKTKTRSHGVWVEDAFRTLCANDYLFLLTVARRQRDASPEEGYAEEDCICIGSREDLAAEMRVSIHTLDASRDFLLRCGLLFYSKEGGVYKDIDNPNVTKHYTNVYRLNMPGLARLSHSCPRRGPEKSTTWTKKVHDVDTEYTHSIKRNIIRDDALEIIQTYIAATFSVPAEWVGIDGLRAAVKGKDPAVVREAISRFAKEHPGAVGIRNGEIRGIPWLISTLKRIPAAVSPQSMTLGQLGSLFSAPVAATPAKGPLEEVWATLRKELGLDALPAEARDAVRRAYTRHFNRYSDADRSLALGIFAENYLSCRGAASFEELRTRLGTAAERANDLCEFLKSLPK